MIRLRIKSSMLRHAQTISLQVPADGATWMCANPVCWIMTKRVHDNEFPDYREAKSERMNAAWLRPWYGHAEHFHVRIACPADSAECKPQPPPDPSDGCGNELDFWFKESTLHPPPPVVAQTETSTDRRLARCVYWLAREPLLDCSKTAHFSAQNFKPEFTVR